MQVTRQVRYRHNKYHRHLRHHLQARLRHNNSAQQAII
jgi:hypothetical protein